MTTMVRFWFLTIFASLILHQNSIAYADNTYDFFNPNVISPTLIAPQNAATGIDVTGISLLWNAAASATSYKVDLADNINFFNTATWTTSATTLTTASLKQNVTYYWRVTSINGSTASGTSAVWSFTTATISVTPTLSAPANAAVNIATSGTDLTWTAVAVASKYTVEWADNPQFIRSTDSTLSATTLNTGVLQPGTKYYWRVRAENVGGEGAWSSARLFTTVGLMSAPVLNTPADGATSQLTSGVTLRWNTIANANTYTIQYADNPDFVNYKFVTSASNFTITPKLRPNTTFYWRVSAGNNLNNLVSPLSEKRSFTTTSGNTSTTLTSPPDGFAGVNIAGASLQWNTVDAVASVGSYVVEWRIIPILSILTLV